MAESARSVAIRAARDAGRALLDLYGRVEQIRYKGDIDLVTEADDRSERIIIDALRSNFSDHFILSEESGLSDPAAVGGRHRWIIDPLDGTTNFAHAYPMFAVSIALEVDGAVQLGVVYAPLLDELFIAERGAGATLNGERLRVSTTDLLLRAMLATGFHYDREAARDNVGHWRDFLRESQAVRRDGSAALNLCNVAAGRFDGYWELSVFPWDTAAGGVMVEEAGGMITDVYGQPFRVDEPTCLATNGAIHAAMLDVLARGRRDLAAGRTV